MKTADIVTGFILIAGILFSSCGGTGIKDTAVHTLSLETVEISHTSTYSKMTVILAVSASNRIGEAFKFSKSGKTAHAVQNLIAYTRLCTEGIPRTLKLAREETDFTTMCSVLMDALSTHEQTMISMLPSAPEELTEEIIKAEKSRSALVTEIKNSLDLK